LLPQFNDRPVGCPTAASFFFVGVIESRCLSVEWESFRELSLDTNGKIVKKILFKAGLLFALLISAGAQATDVGVSLQFGQPGFYGNLDIGNFQQPQLIYSEPRIVERAYSPRPPLYLVVPPGHSRHWRKNCRRYDACNRPVYFVQERWYNDVVVPRYRGGYYSRDDRDGWRGHDGRDRRDHRDNRSYDDHHRRDEHRDDGDREHGRGDDRGNGNGHGRGGRND
jgi:hypothetical protein